MKHVARGGTAMVFIDSNGVRRSLTYSIHFPLPALPVRCECVFVLKIERNNVLFLLSERGVAMDFIQE